jgi:hypothetical protein
MKGVPARVGNNFERFYIDLGVICKYYNLHYVVYTPKKKVLPYNKQNNKQKITPKMILKKNNLMSILDRLFENSNFQYLKSGPILMIYKKGTPTKTIMNALNAKLIKIRKQFDYTFKTKGGFVFKVDDLGNNNILFGKLQGTFRDNLLQSLDHYPNIVGTKIGEFFEHRVPVISYIKFNTLLNSLIKQKTIGQEMKEGKIIMVSRLIPYKIIKKNRDEKFWFNYLTEFKSELIIPWLNKKEWRSTKIEALLLLRAEILSKYKNWVPILQKIPEYNSYSNPHSKEMVTSTTHRQHWRIQRKSCNIPQQESIIQNKQIEFHYYPNKVLNKKISIDKYKTPWSLDKLLSKKLFKFNDSAELAYHSYLSKELLQSDVRYQNNPTTYATFLYSIETTSNKLKTKILIGYSPEFGLINGVQTFYEHTAILQKKDGIWILVKDFSPNQENTILLENLNSIPSKNSTKEMSKALERLIKKIETKKKTGTE